MEGDHKQAEKGARHLGAKWHTCAWFPAQVVFVSSEVAPWSKTGGLADVMGALPTALARRCACIWLPTVLTSFTGSAVNVLIAGTSMSAEGIVSWL
jgi:hypothetical protein